MNRPTAYQPRTYRTGMGKGRFRSITAVYLDTDLWIGYNAPDAEHLEVPIRAKVMETIRGLRAAVDDYCRRDNKFLTSLTPYESLEPAPDIIRIMFQAAHPAGVGPMAAVAGAFAGETARILEAAFELTELVIENGGDNYLKLIRPALISVFAGASPLSEKIALEIPAESTPLGICTSSGTVGPSLSFGRADAMTIACQDPARADAYATYFGNRVKNGSDIEPVLDEIGGHPDILAALIVLGDRMGIRGKFPIKTL
jgi:ApbE superfamily uncharacterized protein (UPF0280 family)